MSFRVSVKLMFIIGLILTFTVAQSLVGFAQLTLPVEQKSWIKTPRNADECMLRSLPGTTSDVAAQRITEACYRLYPSASRPDPKPFEPVVQPHRSLETDQEQKLRPLDRRKIVLNGTPIFLDQDNKYLLRLFFSNNNSDIHVTRVEVQVRHVRLPQDRYIATVKLTPGGTAEGHIWLPKTDLSQAQFDIVRAWGIPILR